MAAAGGPSRKGQITGSVITVIHLQPARHGAKPALLLSVPLSSPLYGWKQVEVGFSV